MLVKLNGKFFEKKLQFQFHQHSTSSFCSLRSQKHKKKTDNFSVFFALLGSGCVKVACRMLMKLTPGRRNSGVVGSSGLTVFPIVVRTEQTGNWFD